jgi:NAD(P)-dependent dehydrogenase (short-subunit alcohol dehydrogenase family)
VIVTGASRGLGRGVALELARTGYSVAVNYRGNREAAEATVAACAKIAPAGSGARFVPIQADVSRPEDRARLVERAFTELAPVTALVNNAGIAPRERADIVEASEASFEELIATNLQGPYFLTQAVVRRWLAEGAAEAGAQPAAAPHRAIVFVTSISATTVSINRGEYCISKAGLAMAAQLWATRLAPEGIGVYEIRPGIMATDMTAGVKEKYDALIADGLVPQRRWGKPEDIGRAVRSLVDGDFAFSTGAAIYSDGGFNISRL